MRMRRFPQVRRRVDGTAVPKRGVDSSEWAGVGVALHSGELRVPSARPAWKHRIPSQRSGNNRRWSPIPRAEASPEALPVRGRFIPELGLVLAADIVALTLVTTLAGSLFAVLTACIAVMTWKLRGLYSRRIALSVLDDLPSLAAGVLVAVAPATAVAVASDSVSGRSALLVCGGVLTAMVLGRTLAYAAILRWRASGRINHRTVMVGAGAPAMALTQRIQQHPGSGLRLVGTVANRAGRSPGPLPLLGTSRDLAKVINQWHITSVVIGYGGMSPADLVELLRTCDRVNVEIYVVPRLFELQTLRGGDDHIWGLPLVRMRRPVQRAVAWRVKRAFDVAMAAMALIFAAPVFIAVALAVRFELGPGVIFRQTRVGREGRTFDLMKFRSVRTPPPGAESPWTVSDDSIGKVGRFIRRYSLDELPQLVNVVRGDMSLVGPRPERPEYVKQFCAGVPRYVHRHRVPVGMTGLAAVNGLRGDTSIEDRAQFDNWYIDNWSLWMDTKILIRTLDSVLRGTGG